MSRKILRASEGYIYTNGIDFGREILLAEDAIFSKYYEIPIEEYREIMAQKEKELGEI